MWAPGGTPPTRVSGMRLIAAARATPVG
jgi:hypothetical protein